MMDALTIAPLSQSEFSMHDQLTILIPTFRCAAYVPAAVASALSTPVGRILIADDGSDPDTLAVVEGIAAANPGRIRVLASAENRGTAANLNQAVDQVQTPFFSKLDGDDVLIPGYLEKAFPIIASRPRLAVLAGHELRIGADEALEFRPELLPKARDRAAPTIMSAAEAFRFIIRWNPNPTSSGVIYRTAAFREVGGFDREIKWGEDWEIWLRFAKRWEVGYIDAASALYRIHQQSTTAATTRQNRLCYGYDAVYRRAAELCDDPDIFPLVRRQMFYVAKLFVGAAARQLRISRRDSLECCRHAAQALSIAVRAAGGGAEFIGGSGSTRRDAVEPLRPQVHE